MNLLLINNGFFIKYAEAIESKFEYYNNNSFDDLKFEILYVSDKEIKVKIEYPVYKNKRRKKVFTGEALRTIGYEIIEEIIPFHSTRDIEYTRLKFKFGEGFLNVYDTMSLSYLSIDDVGLKRQDIGSISYVGGIVDGKRHGFGELTFSNGSKYIGEFKDGKKEGRGTYVTKREMYVGEWKNDAKNGYGVQYESDGSRYEGIFMHDKTNGRGVFTYKDGTYEIAKYHNDCLTGDETLKPRAYVKFKVKDFVDDSSFILEPNAYTLNESLVLRIIDVNKDSIKISLIYLVKEDEKQNVKEEEFTLPLDNKYHRLDFTYIDDSKNVRSWLLFLNEDSTLDNDNVNFRYIYSNGGVFSGITDGKFPVDGRIDLADKEYYIGKLKDGKLDGLGEFYLKDGSVIRGNFKDDMPDGIVRYTDPDGNTIKRKYFSWAYPNEDGVDMYKDIEE